MPKQRHKGRRNVLFELQMKTRRGEDWGGDAEDRGRKESNKKEKAQLCN